MDINKLKMYKGVKRFIDGVIVISAVLAIITWVLNKKNLVHIEQVWVFFPSYFLLLILTIMSNIGIEMVICDIKKEIRKSCERVYVIKQVNDKFVIFDDNDRECLNHVYDTPEEAEEGLMTLIKQKGEKFIRKETKE